MTRTFLSLSKKECKESYRKLIENSDNHIAVSEKIIEIKAYGIAISHLILATEELVKGLIIFLDGEGLRIRKVNGVKKLFSDHSTRHFFSAIFILVTNVIKPTMELIQNYKEILHREEDKTLKAEIEIAAVSNDSSKMEQATNIFLSKFAKHHVDKFSIHLDFWNDAEMQKQNGFYVDYRNKLLSPEKFNEIDYITAAEITRSFITECKDFIKYIDSLKSIDKQNFINMINRDKEIYNTIEKFIKFNKH